MFKRGKKNLEAEIINLYLFLLLLYKRMCLLLHFVSFDVYRAERPGRADVLAAAASHTDVRVDVRIRESVFVRHHSDGLRRAVLRTSAAARSVGVDDAVFFKEHYFSHLRQVLLFYSQRLDGTIGAAVATYCTV